MPANGRPEGGLHLHRLGHDDGVALGDLLAGGDGDRDDECRPLRAHGDALVAVDPVGDPVDLQQAAGPVRGDHDVALAAGGSDRPLVVVGPVDGDLSDGVPGVHAVGVWPGLEHLQGVLLAVVVQAGRDTRRIDRLRAATLSPRVEGRSCGLALGVAGPDRRDQDGQRVGLGTHAGGGIADLRGDGGEQLAAVAGRVRHHEGAVGQRVAHAGPGRWRGHGHGRRCAGPRRSRRQRPPQRTRRSGSRGPAAGGRGAPRRPPGRRPPAGAPRSRGPRRRERCVAEVRQVGGEQFLGQGPAAQGSTVTPRPGRPRGPDPG